LKGSGKLVVLCSHQLRCLSHADRVVVLHQGQVEFDGTYEAAQAQDALRHIRGTAAEAAATAEGAQPEVPEPEEEEKAGEEGEKKQEESANEAEDSSGRLTEAEHRDTGSVDSEAYFAYVGLVGGGSTMAILFAASLCAISNVMVNWWLSRWSGGTSGYTDAEALQLYAGLSLVGTLCVMVFQALCVFSSIRASEALHHRTFSSLLRAPTSFFDTTPFGRIINRFSADMSAVDRKLMTALSTAVNLLLMIVAIILMNLIVVPWLVLGFVPLFALYWYIAGIYRASSRELKRLDSISLSPVFSTFSESMDGLATIRAYGAPESMLSQVIVQLERNTEAWLKNNLVNRWMGVRLDWIGVGFVAATAWGCVLVIRYSSDDTELVSMDPGLVGLLLSYVAVVTGQLNWGVRNVSEVEQHMTSVERIFWLIAQPAEKWHPEAAVPEFAESWPATGSLEIRGLSLRYRPGLPLVLREVSIGPIPSGHRLGVCGRTGSGKSTLALALFRFIEPAAGQILIDGVATGELPLERHRRGLAMIPQEPVLFGGSVWHNVDPVASHSEEAVLKAVRDVGLSEWLDSNGGLGYEVSDGGENLSQGQRQLLCLARVLLASPKVLVMDEATSSLDRATDEAIQSLLRDRTGPLAGATVVAIAHRLETILDYDTVCVLDKGRVVECGPPQELLAQRSGAFKDLVQENSRQARRR